MRKRIVAGAHSKLGCDKLPIRLEELRVHVIAQLKIGWTPEQIAGRLEYDDQPVRVSHETIYAYVYKRHKSTIFREIKRNFWADDALGNQT